MPVNVEPIAGERALMVAAAGKKHLVAGDLHIGMEEELERRGFRIPDQTGRTLARLTRLIDGGKPDRLVLLGDVKHQVPFAEKWEMRKVFCLLDALSGMVPVTIVTGNHDGGIAAMAPEGVKIVGSLVVGDVGMVHGHGWPPEKVMRSCALVVAHAHPCVILRDECGRAITEACWLRASFLKKKAKEHYKAPFPELIVMPAFGDIRSGYPVNEERGRLLGPIFRNGLVNVPGARVWLPDGTFLGFVRDLNPYGRTPGGVRQ
jgi:putative SbcD/Mre11-related phosphoesterase